MEKRPNQQQQQGNTGQQQGDVSGLGDSDASRASGQQRGGASLGQEHQTDMQRGSQQGAGQGSARQPQQFDTQGRGQQGGMGSDSRFADQIREHMEVVDAAGKHCGTVDHLEGDRIKLSRTDSPDGQHHYVSMSQVAGIEGGKVCLRERGDNDFGMER